LAINTSEILVRLDHQILLYLARGLLTLLAVPLHAQAQANVIVVTTIQAAIDAFDLTSI